MRWRVTSDGGHLWLVMHGDYVVEIFRDWSLAMHRANREAIATMQKEEGRV